MEHVSVSETRLPSDLLARLRPGGPEPRDEVWGGELHMVPPPHSEHGRLELKLGAFFDLHWEQPGLGLVCLEAGVKRPGTQQVEVLGRRLPSDYRTPDLSLVLPGRFERLVDGWIVGGPDVVIEVESPGDESRAKLPFYLEVGVREVVLIDRDERRVQLLRATPSGWTTVPATADGWLRSQLLRTELRTEPPTGPGRPPALRLRRSDDPSREAVIG